MTDYRCPPMILDPASGRYCCTQGCCSYRLHPSIPMDAMKWGGTETQTDEEWARRRRTAETLASVDETRCKGATEMIDSLLNKATSGASVEWKYGPSADPIGDLRKAAKMVAEVAPHTRALSELIESDVAAMAHRRRDQVEAQVERHREAIEALQARGIEVWLEEGPMEFESKPEDGQWTVRGTSTVRIRWTGDGL